MLSGSNITKRLHTRRGGHTAFGGVGCRMPVWSSIGAMREELDAMDAMRLRPHVPELLAPAGSFSALLAAVAAGADAVYTGMGAFNARAAACDLDESELARAVVFAHAHACRVYVTMNVYLRPGELDAALVFAGRALGAGADALIVADAGLARALSEAYPGVELHLSTQAGVMSAAGVHAVARELNVARVTCARELSISELAGLAQTGVEIEAFCHGAICICYSGACAASALRRGRSANRGDCTQPCRLPYRLVDERGATHAAVEGDRLLCPRDYLSIAHIAELCEAGVGALKIEGRMKNPDYVFNVVRIYREALDAWAAGAPLDAAAIDDAVARLGRSFNRGFTDAYLRGESGAELMSFERAINQGVPVGQVVERRRDEVLVELTAPVGVGDTLEIRSTPAPDAPADVPKRWPMVPCAVDGAPGECIRVGVKRRVEVGSPVHATATARVRQAACEAVAAAQREAEALAVRPPRPLAAKPITPSLLPAVPDCSHATVVAVAADLPQARRWLSLPAVRDGVLEIAVCAWALEGECCDSDAARADLGRLTVVLDEPCRAADEPRCRMYIRAAASVVCRNWGQVALAMEEGAAWEVAPPLSATHDATVTYLAARGARRIWLPDELSSDEACAVARRAPRGSVGVLACGSAQLMVCEHCVLTAEGPCSGAHADCARRQAVRFLEDTGAVRLPVRVDAHGRTRIYDADALDRTADMAALYAAGVRAYRLDALSCAPEQADENLARLLEALRSVQGGAVCA